MIPILRTPPQALQAIFAAATPLARTTHFVRRLRCLRPDVFARTLSLFRVQHPHASLEQLAGPLHLSALALGRRLRSRAAATFLEALLRHAVRQLATAALPPATIPVLRRFNGVYLTDGTVVRLPASLADRFPGYGGGDGPDDASATAAAKVVLRLRLDTTTATELRVVAATTPDVQALGPLPGLPAGARHLADLGFFGTADLATRTAAGVFWLTRRPVRARVIARRCPPEEAARRRQKVHDRMRRKGKSAGARQLALCDWWVLATNTPAARLPAAAAWDVCRARWQVELAFKRWKSLGHLRVDPTHGPIRAECELYGALLGVIVVDWLAIRRGGLLSARSVWRAWQIVRELLPQVEWAFDGRVDWAGVWEELARRLDQRPVLPRRKRAPSTRQRLFRASLVA